MDNRPAAVAQRELAESLIHSPRVLQQRALSDAIHNSQRMVAQRHEMNALFGRVVRPQGDGPMPAASSPAQREEKPNDTGLPNSLKSGIESLSGMSMDHVKVHYNSDKPAQLQAHAYAQGSEIHLGAGQERHLPHEAWHVVQQAQGRVRPTLQMKAGAVNDDPSLEKEADMMGEKAAQLEAYHDARNLVAGGSVAGTVTQRVAPRHAPPRGKGATIQREEISITSGPNSVTHIRFRAAKGLEIEHGKTYVVYLPSGVANESHELIADKLGVPLARLDFVNEQHDKVPMTVYQDGAPLRFTAALSEEYKVARAKQLVVDYLHQCGIGKISGSDVALLLKAQSVKFYDTDEWAEYMKHMPGFGSAESTEGVTEPGALGKRKVNINRMNHTLNAVVHELFHSVESALLHSVQPGLVEAMTEYFALKATGLTFRRSVDSPKAIYADNLRFLRIALSKGVVGEAALQNAYFLGKTDEIAVLVEAWSKYARIAEKVNFLYTGKIPTREQIDQMWAEVEKLF